MEEVKEIPSSIYPNGDFEQIEATQLMIPWWFVIVFLLLCFALLKKFIYTKDEKKHGK